MDTLVSREEAGWSVEQQRTAGEAKVGVDGRGRRRDGTEYGSERDYEREGERKRESETVESRQGEAGPSGQPEPSRAEPLRSSWSPAGCRRGPPPGCRRSCRLPLRLR